MCRARPGPRCSNSGRKRYSSAVRNLNKVQEQADKYIEKHRDENTSGGDENSSHNEDDVQLPKNLKAKLHNAHLRLEQANRVYHATPAGQRDLENQIEKIRASLPKRKPSPSKAGALKLWNSKQDKIARLEKMKEAGESRRENSYLDYHDFIEERPQTRQEAINRDAEFSPRAQRNKSGIDYTTGDPKSLKLEPLTDEQLERADTWVETGADSEWEKRGTTRPPKKIGSENIGKKAADSLTKMTRLSMPDGSVVEGRHDLHITENEDGKFIVSLRTTVAASFEDASPVDKNTQELGHILTKTRGKDVVQKIGEFDSLHAAKTRRGMIANSSDNLPDDERVNFPGTIANIGRGLTIARFASTTPDKTGEVPSPQNRGWVVPQYRYQETSMAESTQSIKERRAAKPTPSGDTNDKGEGEENP